MSYDIGNHYHLDGRNHVAKNARQWLGRTDFWGSDRHSQYDGAIRRCMAWDDRVRAAAERSDDLASSFATFCTTAIMHCICRRSCIDNDEFKANGMNAGKGNSERERGVWCEGGDSNPHILRTLTPEASASTNSATFAQIISFLLLYRFVGARGGTRTPTS